MIGPGGGDDGNDSDDAGVGDVAGAGDDGYDDMCLRLSLSM